MKNLEFRITFDTMNTIIFIKVKTMNEPITVTYVLEEFLKELKQEIKDVNNKLDTMQRDFNSKLDTTQKDFNNKLDTMQKDVNNKLDYIQKDVTDLKVGVTEVGNIKKDIKTLKEDVKDLKKDQTFLIQEIADLKGVKALIIPIIVAIATALLTLLFRLIPNINS